MVLIKIICYNYDGGKLVSCEVKKELCRPEYNAEVRGSWIEMLRDKKQCNLKTVEYVEHAFVQYKNMRIYIYIYKK